MQKILYGQRNHIGVLMILCPFEGKYFSGSLSLYFVSEPCVQIGKNLWNNFVSPASMRRSIYDDSLELLCPDANAPLPLTKGHSKRNPSLGMV